MGRIAPRQILRGAALAVVASAMITPLSLMAASAAAPSGGCPVNGGYVVQDASAFPGLQALDAKGNHDGIVCVKILPNADIAHFHFVAIDNAVQG